MIDLGFLLLSAAAGLAIGSFLNVVIYRLPRELSVSQPRRSFCPACGTDIAWWDNIPVVSWVLLRGRCRHCRQPISIQYPLIELLNAIVFVAVFDALIIGGVNSGVTGSISDAIVVVAYWSLFGALLANAVIDLEQYIIDVRLTYFAMIVGVVAAGAVGAIGTTPVPLPDMRLGTAALAMGIVWVITAWVAERVRGPDAETPMDAELAMGSDAGEVAPADLAGDATIPGTADSAEESSEIVAVDASATEAPPLIPASPPPYRWTSHAIPILLLGLVFVGLVAAPFIAETRGPGSPAFAARAITTLSAIVFVLILAAMQPRQSDTDMVAIIEDERPRARRVAVGELAWLAPTLLAGIAAFWLAGHFFAASPASRLPFAPPPEPPSWTAVFGPDVPWYGRAIAGALGGLTGLISGAALGWGVRIFFTLVFGKEAFGTGDIYLLAAIGAVGGFWLSLIAFFAASLLALFGVVACSVRKSCRALPFGPWLAVGALVALWIQTPFVATVRPALATLWNLVLNRSLAEP